MKESIRVFMIIILAVYKIIYHAKHRIVFMKSTFLFLQKTYLFKLYLLVFVKHFKLKFHQ